MKTRSSQNAELCASRLREAMREKNIKSAELSRITGISEVNMSHYRTGKCIPKLDNVKLLGEALGVNPMWLWGMTNVKDLVVLDKKAQMWNQIECLFETLNGEQMEKVYNFIVDYIL